MSSTLGYGLARLGSVIDKLAHIELWDDDDSDGKTRIIVQDVRQERPKKPKPKSTKKYGAHRGRKLCGMNQEESSRPKAKSSWIVTDLYTDLPFVHSLAPTASLSISMTEASTSLTHSKSDREDRKQDGLNEGTVDSDRWDPALRQPGHCHKLPTFIPVKPPKEIAVVPFQEIDNHTKQEKPSRRKREKNLSIA